MKKIMVLLFLAGFLAGVLSVLTALEWMQGSPLSTHLPWPSQTKTGRIDLETTTGTPPRPSFIQTARPTLRLPVSHVILDACFQPMPAPSKNPQSAALAPDKIEAQTNATWATKIRAMAGLPNATPTSKTSGPKKMAATPRTALTTTAGTTLPPDPSDVARPKTTIQTKAKARTLPGPDQLYAQALKLYQSGQHARSRTEFEAFARAYPKHRLIPNALYWTGETWYAQQRFDRAKGTFIQVSTRYPGHAKSPDALLKQAYCALRMGNTVLAQQLLHNLHDRYPKSAASALGLRVLRGLQDHGAASLLGVAHG